MGCNCGRKKRIKQAAKPVQKVAKKPVQHKYVGRKTKYTK